MNIINSYIFEQPKLSTPTTVTALVNADNKQQSVQRAQDSYRKNAAAAAIIDAEYVDFRPNSKPLSQERRDLNYTLEVENTASRQLSEMIPTINSSINKYQSTPMDLPLPGTYINTFA